MNVFKTVIKLLLIFSLFPVIYYGSLIALVSWDAYGYNNFQEKLKSKFIALKSETLQISVCHEWKCTFEYKHKDKQNYLFLIFGEDNLDDRLSLMVEISEDFENRMAKCRHMQEGSKICQL